MATAQDVDLSETWIRGQYNKGTLDTLSDPFDIVNDHQKYQKTNTSGSTSTNKDIPISVSEGNKLHDSIWPTSQPMNQFAANSFANYLSKSNSGRTGVQTGTYNSKRYNDPLSHNFDTQSLTISKRFNPHDNGLCQSTRLRTSQKKEEPEKRKTHTTYGTLHMDLQKHPKL